MSNGLEQPFIVSGLTARRLFGEIERLMPGFDTGDHLHGKFAASPAASGITTDCMALAMIGAGKPAAYKADGRYESRRMPHFQQRPRASKKKRGRA